MKFYELSGTDEGNKCPLNHKNRLHNSCAMRFYVCRSQSESYPVTQFILEVKQLPRLQNFVFTAQLLDKSMNQNRSCDNVYYMFLKFPTRLEIKNAIKENSHSSIDKEHILFCIALIQIKYLNLL